MAKIKFWLLTQSLFSCGTKILVTETCNQSNICFSMFIHSPLSRLQVLHNLKYLNVRHVNTKRLTDIPQMGPLPLVNLRPMVLSNTHTLFLWISHPLTISNMVWKDVILPSLDVHTLKNTLEDASLWIMHLYISTLSTNWVSHNLKPPEKNRTLSNLPWIVLCL